MAAKMLATLALLFLIFNISRYQLERFRKLDYYYVLAALILLSAVYYKWGVIDTRLPDVIFGVFDNRNPIAWFSSSAAIISFFHVLHARNRIHLLLFSISFLLLASATLSLSSRGALLGLLAGMIIVAFSKVDSLKSFFVYFSISLIAFLTVITVIELYYSDYFSSLIERADSHRFEIYANAITRITESPSTLFFGHGIAASPRNMVGETVINNWHSIYINATFYGGIIALVLLLVCLLKRPYEIIIKKSKISSWDAVVLGMMVTLQFDGHRIYEYPGGLLFVLTIPMFVANILASSNKKLNMKTKENV
ncbi:O-antigen ligase family protein [Endozoicomonas sp. 4G]|uniref:O-antigen ligase family protein n=1 Tax=Endozoicomonas sp. 4G TaxID=2872754 RepID=UPI00207862C7|nr:O-antigen ligase family protein [Endozoicomonas sp. 4G]